MTLGDPDIVSFGISLEIDAYLKPFNDLQPFQQTNLLYDLRIALIQIEGLGFDVPTTLSPIRLNAGLYLEELTKPNLFKTILKIDRAFNLVEFILDRKLAGFAQD